MEGVYYLRTQGPTLEARPVEEDAPVVLRVADVVEDGSSMIYELRYFGMQPGTYDLRDSLQRVDGQPLTGLEPMKIAVCSVLPDDHNGQLDELLALGLPGAWPYRAMLIALAALWAVPFGWAVASRLGRRRQAPKAAPVKELTLADQLRPLVEAAVAGKLSTENQARLERLLIAHWRTQLDLAGCTTAEALARMREHPGSAELLVALERWLHEPPGRHEVDVAEVLRPYGDQPAVEVPLIAVAEAAP